MNVHCDLCGLDFDSSCAQAGCQGCPVSRNCQHLICPRCGYMILPEAALLRWLRRVGELWTEKKTKLKERM